MSDLKKCPICGGALRTVDSRPHGATDVLVRRRLKCLGCAAKFTTHEVIVSDAAQIGATLQIVAAHQRAVKALDALLADLSEEELFFARKSIGNLKVAQ